MMYPRGVIAMSSGMILLFGHFTAFAVIFSNSSISPTSRDGLVALIVPLTVASLTSAALYASKNAELDLWSTPKTNLFFNIFSILIPLIFFSIIIYGLFNLDGDHDVKDFKRYMIAAEAVFGAVFAIMVEAVFGNPRKSDLPTNDDNSEAT